MLVIVIMELSFKLLINVLQPWPNYAILLKKLSTSIEM